MKFGCRIMLAPPTRAFWGRTSMMVSPVTRARGAETQETYLLRLAGPQRLAGQVERVQTGRAGRVQRQTRTVQVKEPRDAVRQHGPARPGGRVLGEVVDVALGDHLVVVGHDADVDGRVASGQLLHGDASWRAAGDTRLTVSLSHRWAPLAGAVGNVQVNVQVLTIFEALVRDLEQFPLHGVLLEVQSQPARKKDSR